MALPTPRAIVDCSINPQGLANSITTNDFCQRMRLFSRVIRNLADIYGSHLTFNRGAFGCFHGRGRTDTMKTSPVNVSKKEKAEFPSPLERNHEKKADHHMMIRLTNKRRFSNDLTTKGTSQGEMHCPEHSPAA